MENSNDKYKYKKKQLFGGLFNMGENNKIKVCSSINEDIRGIVYNPQGMAFLEYIPEAVLALDENLTAIYWNELAEKTTGWLADELVGQSIEEIFRKLHINYSFEENDNILTTDDLRRWEMSAYRKDEKCICLDVHIKRTIIQEEQDQITVVSFRDITRHKKFELNYWKKKQEYIDIIDSVSEGCFLNDFEKRKVYCSNKWKARLGMGALSLEEVKLAYSNTIHPDDIERIESIHLCAMERKEQNVRAEFRVKTKDAGYMWVLGQGKIIYNQDGRPLRYYGAHVDITECKQAEILLRESKKRQSLLLTLSDLLHSLEDSKDIQTKASHILGEYLEVDGVWYCDLKEGLDSSISDCRYSRLVVSNDEMDRKHIDSEAYNKVNSIMGEMYSNSTFVAKDINTSILSDKERAVFEELSIQAFVCVPLLRDGKTVAMLNVYQKVPRNWSGDEITLIEEVLIRTWAAVERAKAQTALNASEEKYRKIVTAANEGIICLNSKNVIFYCNEIIAKVLGYRVEELTGKHVNEIIFKEDIDKAMQYKEKIKSGLSKMYNLKLRKRDGSYAWLMVSAAPLNDENGKFDGILAMLTDINQHKRLEDELRFQKELFEKVIDNIPIPFTIYDKSGKLILKNAQSRNLYEKPEILDSIESLHRGLKSYDIYGNRIPDEDRPLNHALKGVVVRDEIVVVELNEKQQIIEVNSFPIFDKDGDVLSVAIFHKDITEFVQNQRLIKSQQEKMLEVKKDKIEALTNAIKMKDEFLTLISHEFKTPITVIFSALQLIKSICTSELSEKMNKYLGIITQNTYRQLRLVNNIIDITSANGSLIKLNKKNMDVVSLTKVITESIKFYSEQKGIKLSFSSTMKEKVIGIDDEKYERIILNLLSNAVKFTPKGESINVKVFQKIVDSKRKVCIEVKDGGVGIPAEKQAVIFEKFGQVDSSLSRQAEGTGIGLSLVKKFVELLEGEISLKSEINKGSTFTVMLPVEKVKENIKEEIFQNDRIIQSTAIEFSDIYI